MSFSLHSFFIPVMGTGHTVDTPIRVAPFGITSVISLVDDVLLEQVRKHYCEQEALSYSEITRQTPNGRALRVEAYLNTVGELVQKKIDQIKSLPFASGNDKDRYFTLLPAQHPLRQKYQQTLSMSESAEKEKLIAELNEEIVAGDIQTNIMVKLDSERRDLGTGELLTDEYTDSKAALKGFADSHIDGGIVFSAGINQSLFQYMTQFSGFYRNTMGKLKKRIIVKVSDFRSAMIQGKFLARKGLEISEFRIESGLNCGGHAFPSQGELLPALLREFSEKKEQLLEQFKPMIEKYYRKNNMDTSVLDNMQAPLITVQGGIGNHGEVERLHEEYGVDATGWGSPFLLVPEATPVDAPTMDLLKEATDKELYLSPASPLDFPFNNIRGSFSERKREELIEAGSPGSPCPKGFLSVNTEFTDVAICKASKRYIKAKLKEIEEQNLEPEAKEKALDKVLTKSCICHHLGNGALISLGEAEVGNAPQAICPGPNIAWFTREYSLEEMVAHIYGEGETLTPPERPHMFAKEISMYVEYFESLCNDFDGTAERKKYLATFADNLRSGMEYCRAVSKQVFEGENLQSIEDTIAGAIPQLESLEAKIA
jgi:hypothetical protein